MSWALAGWGPMGRSRRVVVQEGSGCEQLLDAEARTSRAALESSWNVAQAAALSAPLGTSVSDS